MPDEAVDLHVVGGGEQQFGIVLKKYKAQIMERANLGRGPKPSALRS